MNVILHWLFVCLICIGDGTLEVDEVLGNIDVINYHCFYGKELMQEFKSIDRDGDGVIR